MSDESQADLLPAEVLEFLVRALPSRTLWAWLSEQPQIPLRQRVAQGFRATPEVLRQPVVRTRLTSHLQNTPDDAQSLLALWGGDSPKALEAVRAQPEDESLIAQLPLLQAMHGEALVLALLHEKREAALEAWADHDDVQPEARAATAQETGDESALIARNASLEKQLERAQTRLEQLRAKSQEFKAGATNTGKLLQEKLRAHERSARDATRQARQAELKLEVLQAKLGEAEKVRERAERKARSTLTEMEEAQAETKTLRRQVHRLQQINEELRRRVSARDAAPNLQPNLQPAAPEKPDPQPAATTRVLVPAQTVDRTGSLPGLKLSLQQLQAAIDRNDEAAVATAANQVRDLRERDPAAAQKLVKQVRQLGRYYEKVLCASTTRVLVDASNVARHDGPGKGKLSHLFAMREELRRSEFFPILFVADASLPYHIDDPDEFRRMMKSGEVLVSASGQEADEILARMARETGAYVVTNDRNFHRHLAPAFTPLRIGFQIFEGVVVLEEF